MMLISAIVTIWLIVAIFFVILCRGAASADREDDVWAGRYPTGSANARSDVAAIVLGKDRPAPAPAEVRPRARGARGRAGQYAARS